jgi:anaerobic ribonucleoside-triphosphate reductase
VIRLTDKQIKAKKEWIHHYINAENAATGSKLDANANVASKNIATLDAELFKDFKIQLNRSLIKERIEGMFGEELANYYIEDLEDHLIYTHDETSLAPYCVSINMYPFLTDGMEGLGGDSRAPKHLTSFCGNFVNLAFAIASQFAGAVATVEFLMYFDYFARKDFGDAYLDTNKEEVLQQLQGVVYALNQPAAARGFQSIFWNISTFDKYFFEGMFGTFVFPDMTSPSWESLDNLQKVWHQWFREERTKNLLTFPVVTHAAIAKDDGQTWKDQDSRDFIADELSKGGEFFIYTSQTADSLASCCRVRNEIQEESPLVPRT